MEHGFTHSEICRKLGLKERVLINWAEKRLVRPVKDADGYSSRRLYSARNVFEIAIIQALWGKYSISIIQTVLIWLKQFENYNEMPAYIFFDSSDPSKMVLLSHEDLAQKDHEDIAQRNYKGVKYRVMASEAETSVLVNISLIRKKVAGLFELYEIFPK
jgi:DNA-binding transcriptional MerR regulator